MRLKEIIKEEMSIGGIGSGMIAVAPVGVGGMQKRNPDGTAKNALDQDNLLGGTKKKKKKKKLSENDISKLKSLEKELKSTEKKIQAGDANYTDKATMDLVQKTVNTIAVINFEQMAVDMFKKFVEQVDLGIKQGKYSAEDLPKMQKARDEMAAQIPTLEKFAAKAKDRIAKHTGNEVGMEDMKDDYEDMEKVPDLEDDLDNLKAKFDAMLKQMKRQ